MAYWYKVRTWGYRFDIKPKMEKIEIEKETKHTLLRTIGVREHKVTEYHRYFSTWKEAHNFMIECIKSEIRETRKKLSEKISNLKIAQSLKEE